MALDATARRRWFGGLVLLGAAAMLVCGETLLQGRLNGWLFIIYWPVCLLLTALAALVAVQDFRDLQRRARQQHRDLLETTLKQIETDARTKQRQPRRNNRP